MKKIENPEKWKLEQILAIQNEVRQIDREVTKAEESGEMKDLESQLDALDE